MINIIFLQFFFQVIILILDQNYLNVGMIVTQKLANNSDLVRHLNLSKFIFFNYNIILYGLDKRNAICILSFNKFNMQIFNI